MKFFVTYSIAWHQFHIKYNKILLDGCIDKEIRNKLFQKIEQHSIKSNELRSMK